MASTPQKSSGALGGLFAAVSLLGAALLFWIQPLAGRVLLPQLGGAPFVWVTCIAFFQLVLFGGYLWVHLTRTLAPSRIQLGVLVTLVGLALWRSPSLLDSLASSLQSPTLAVLAFLADRLGLACLALASTAPLLQRAYAQRFGQEPYRLYAVSNAGSLIGLLGYPFFIEPLWSSSVQAHAWRFGFAVYGVLLAMITALTWQTTPALTPSQPLAAELGASPSHDAASVVPTSRRMWFALAAGPAALLAAISNHITVDVTAIPLLWVVPLALYLITFIVAFGSSRRHFDELNRGLWIACSVSLPILLLPGNQTRLGIMLGVPLVTLWVAAMLCHAELARRRPEAGRLTEYYVWLSAGGAFGGSFVAFAAPVLFADHYELALSMLAIHLVLATASRRADRRIAPTGAQRLSWIGAGLAVPILAATLIAQATDAGAGAVVLARTRNFFGPLRVAQTASRIVLTHGRTDHGRQLRDEARRALPIAYFGPDSGAGRALRRHHHDQARKIGVVGLGVGTLAAYGAPSDSIRFYEINPDMVRLAKAYFTYLPSAKARVSIALGDGRLLLRDEAPQKFDLLLLDAFTSDSVPAHLLTVEAFSVYLRQLAPDGILLANVSNRHVAIERIVAGSAQRHGLAMAVHESPSDPKKGLLRARWALLARDANLLTPALVEQSDIVGAERAVVWTDQHASLWSMLAGP